MFNRFNTSQGVVKHKVLHNSFVNLLYKSKFYVNVMMGEVGYITNKIPELMGVLYILEKLGFIVPAAWIIPLCVFGYVGLVFAGWVWKRLGLYDTSVYIETHRNPVQDEILQSARLINNVFGGKDGVVEKDIKSLEGKKS